MSVFSRLKAYWREPLTVAKERHEKIKGSISLVISLVGFTARANHWKIPFLEQAASDIATLWIGIVLGVFCAAWAVLWLPVLASEKQQVKFAGDRDAFQKEVAALNERLRPKFRVECGKHVPHSFTGKPGMCTNVPIYKPDGTLLRLVPGHYHRIVVTADCEGRLTECCGKLERIGDPKNPELWGGDEAKLTFAPANELTTTFSKTIPDKSEAHLDVLCITCDNEIYICTEKFYWRFLPKPNQMFVPKHKYTLVVNIWGKESHAQTVSLEFDWTGDWQTAELKKVT